MRPSLSTFRRAGNLIFVSGQVALDPTGAIGPGGFESQWARCVSNLRDALDGAGCTLEDVVKATVWLTSADLFPAFNAAFGDSFCEPYPARSTVVSQLALPDALVEIEAIAIRPSPERRPASS